MKLPSLLLLFALPDEHLKSIGRGFDVIEASTPDARRDAVIDRGADIQVVLTSGVHGLTGAEIDAMPRLSLIAAFGVGHEAIDKARAGERGIGVVNGPGTNDDSVADHALALLLNSVRGIARQDRAVRQGQWRDDLPMFEQLAGKRVGLLGLGSIGRKIARRVAAFDADVGYHARHPRHDVPYAYFGDLRALAEWSDHLVVAAPGGAATHHLVDADVLAALGAGGILVNVGRGSIVDTEALAVALSSGIIAGAALDVYEGEPRAPASLLGLANVILTPHAAGSSPQAFDAAVDLFIDNARLHFAGMPTLTPVTS